MVAIEQPPSEEEEEVLDEEEKQGQDTHASEVINHTHVHACIILYTTTTHSYCSGFAVA